MWSLLERPPAEEIDAALDGIVRVRAVQELPASRALEFVFLLKRAIADVAGDVVAGSSTEELAAVHAGIDRMALRAFDQFVRCREQIYDLRAREFKRRTASLLERLERQAAEDEDGAHS